MAAKIYVCTVCQTVGKAKKPGSLAIELVLWCCFILPGLIYSLWRFSQKKTVCPACGARAMIPSDSPRGEEYIGDKPQILQTFIEKQAAKKKVFIYVAIGVLAIYTLAPLLSMTSDPSVAVPAPLTAVQKIIKIYPEDAFYWDENTKPHKEAIMKGAHKVLAENERCFEIMPDTADVSVNKGTKQKPQFYIYCKDASGEMFKAYWSEDDIKGGSTLAAIQNPDHHQAVQACKDTVIEKASHPSTVEFAFMEASVKDWPDGRTRVETTFKARSSFNLEVKHYVGCYFEGSKMIDVEIRETP